MRAYTETIESPAGPLTFGVNDEGALLWLRFTEGEYERTVEQELEREGLEIEPDRKPTARAGAQLREYYAGTRRTFDLSLALTASEWQKAVWRAFTSIPYGETRTYGEIVAMVGCPRSARAVGKANATNRLPLVVPCHRVMGADGSLTGFAGGLHLKTRLLEHEAGIIARSANP